MFINSIINSLIGKKVILATETVFSCKTLFLLMSTWGSKREREIVFDLIGPTYRAGFIVFRDLAISPEFN